MDSLLLTFGHATLIFGSFAIFVFATVFGGTRSPIWIRMLAHVDYPPCMGGVVSREVESAYRLCCVWSCAARVWYRFDVCDVARGGGPLRGVRALCFVPKSVRGGCPLRLSSGSLVVDIAHVVVAWGDCPLGRVAALCIVSDSVCPLWCSSVISGVDFAPVIIATRPDVVCKP